MADEHKGLRGNGAAPDSEQESGRNVRAGAHAQANGHDAEHGLSHVTPVRLLVGVFAALMVLTAITVGATMVDLGPRMNLILAMAIATVKAGLVVTYFMHLRWDRPFNTLVFLGSLLFVSLFISMTLLDKSEYEKDIQNMYILKGQ
jgi:cytochrome c oxidase subunit IV